VLTKPLSVVVVIAALPGSVVEQHDDGSQDSMYDLAITYPDGRAGAIEVTAAADAQQLELWKLVGRRGQPWVESTISGGWIVEILSSAKVNGLSRELPNLLRRLEPPMLPRCLTRNRSPLEPMRALVRKAPQSMPTSNCVDRCDFELCPYPPKGLRRFWDEMGARARDRTPKRLLTAHTATDD
jgi:hypothetical protein